jgi:hypothetical protein
MGFTASTRNHCELWIGWYSWYSRMTAALNFGLDEPAGEDTIHHVSNKFEHNLALFGS